MLQIFKFDITMYLSGENELKCYAFNVELWSMNKFFQTYFPVELYNLKSIDNVI